VTAALRGRVAVVTGAGSGLGRAHALALAEAGAQVVVNDLHQEIADRVVTEIRERGGEASAAAASVADWAAGETVVAHATAAYGRIDTVVANAGILRDAMVEDMPEQTWRSVVDTNLTGSFTVIRAAWPHLRRQGFGRLVLTTSASGIFGNRGHANYGAAKAGVLGLARMLAVEGAEYGIVANAVAPLALTPMSGDTSGTRSSASAQLGDLFARMAPEDVAPLVVWLGSPGCTTTGQAFSVGGGRIARIVVGEAEGWCGGRAPSVDDIRRNWAAISTAPPVHEPTRMADELELYRSALAR
jgi:NAD(P)-dependent dehydrogenase (short-subunit alcohol dehydrogenase family)